MDTHTTNNLTEHRLPNLDQVARLGQLLPLRALAVTLEFIDDSQPRYFHQVAISALLRHFLPKDEAYSHFLITDAPESGRLHYRAGDHYNFTILCLAGGEAYLEHLMLALYALPDSAPRTTRRKESFGQNLKWRHFADNFLVPNPSREPITEVEQLSGYTLTQLAQETALWSQHSHFYWQWLSPVRLLKDKDARKDLKGEARYCADSADLNPNLLLARLYDSINALLKARGHIPLPQRGDPPMLRLQRQHCFWIDNAYRDEGHKDHVMGGLLGESVLVTETPLPPPWAHLIVLGQYLGIGQRRSFGWGRYVLTTMDGVSTYPRQHPTRCRGKYILE